MEQQFWLRPTDIHPHLNSWAWPVTLIRWSLLSENDKIDVADDIPSLIKYVQDHTKYQYAVTPISSRTGENIEMLQSEVLNLLEAKKRTF